ncbi:Putative peroxiredoxin [Streptomyces sp. enrichment culture]|uniref:redoxin domain-containing protein n=1 Tax=Streptomyces sp. enrichment culture TaxID=1795815 RepID=UPI003F557CE4
MATTPDPGDSVPEFTLPGGVLRNSEFVRHGYRFDPARSTPLILAFYPQDSSGICTKQLCSCSSGLEQFTRLGAEVRAVSPQDVDSHAKCAQEHGLRMPLLSDTDRAAIRSSPSACPPCTSS